MFFVFFFKKKKKDHSGFKLKNRLEGNQLENYCGNLEERNYSGLEQGISDYKGK